MIPSLLPAYLVLFATLMRALWFTAHRHSALCARCGLPYERRHLGDRACGCKR
jgi:hypothetical protein